jgi:uncharacterized membrane protein YeaQ/YmgE (transglycosylase-associated protein family)
VDRAFQAPAALTPRTVRHDNEATPYTTERTGAMNFIVWIIVGGILGWIASIIMHTNAQQGLMLNVLVGIIGALLAGFLLTPLFGVAPSIRATSACPRCSSHCWGPSSC